MNANAIAELLMWLTPAPWYVRGRVLSRVPDTTGMGTGDQIADMSGRADAAGIVALRNHADAMIALVTAVTAWRDMRHDNVMRAIRQTAEEVESEPAEVHAERVHKLIAAAQAIEAALADFEDVP